MSGRFTRLAGMAAMAVIVFAGCVPENADDTDPAEVQAPLLGCGEDGSEVLLLVDTSERMALSSGFKADGKVLTRIELVEDLLRESLPKFNLAETHGDDGDGNNGDDDVCKKGKTALCHIPPGNPANAHTICIKNKKAIAKHIEKHGDYLGPCKDNEEKDRNVAFRLVTFPYEGNVGKDGQPRVCPTSCAAGKVMDLEGSPSKWIPDYVHNSAIGGQASVGTALEAAMEWAGEASDDGRDRSVILFTGGTYDCGIEDLPQVKALAKRGIPVMVFSFANSTTLDGLAKLAAAGTRPFNGNDSGVYLMYPGMENALVGAMPAPDTEETCDAFDNNCDGQVDEDLVDECSTECGSGYKACSAGVWQECVITDPVPELCDGLDNDCDGETDEDFDVGGTCMGGTGACAGIGTLVCSDDGKDVVCNAEAKPEEEEVCDGVDNDCDGQVDEGLTQACSTACGSGQQACITGKWGECQIKTPNVETCDGLDNDCDGLTDENFDVGEACEVGSGTCMAKGVKVCSEGGLESVCSAGEGVVAGVEICNGKDDDCDGEIDEDWGCANGEVCYQGVCVYD